MGRHIILMGDVTDHGGRVITASGANFAGRKIATVGDMVSCPLHGNNAIVAGGGNPGGAQTNGRIMADAGMSTACGSHLIPSQAMFKTSISIKDEHNVEHNFQLWQRDGPSQPWYNPNGLSPSYNNTYFDAVQYSLQPPDNHWTLPEWATDVPGLPQVPPGMGAR